MTTLVLWIFIAFTYGNTTPTGGAYPNRIDCLENRKAIIHSGQVLSISNCSPLKMTSPTKGDLDEKNNGITNLRSYAFELRNPTKFNRHQ